MQLTKDQHEAAAQALLKAEKTREWAEPISLDYEGADVEDAYAISQRVTELKLAEGRTIGGHKIGLTSKPMRELAGVHEPDFGTIFDDWFFDEGVQLSMQQFNRPLVEVELAFILKEPLGGPDVNSADVIRATECVIPAIEIVDQRYGKRGKPGIVDTVADAASCGGIILGGCPRKLNDIDLPHVAAALYKNGVVEESGTAAAVIGGPIGAVAWLARKLHTFGVAMEAGHTILSGSFIKAHRMSAGDTFTADFGPLGQISFGLID